MASDPRRPDGDPERPLLCAFWAAGYECADQRNGSPGRRGLGVRFAGACVHPVAVHAAWKHPQRWRTHDWWDVVLRPYCEAPALDFLHSQTLRAVPAPVEPPLIAQPQRNPS